MQWQNAMLTIYNVVKDFFTAQALHACVEALDAASVHPAVMGIY